MKPIQIKNESAIAWMLLSPEDAEVARQVCDRASIHPSSVAIRRDGKCIKFLIDCDRVGRRLLKQYYFLRKSLFEHLEIWFLKGNEQLEYCNISLRLPINPPHPLHPKTAAESDRCRQLFSDEENELINAYIAKAAERYGEEAAFSRSHVVAKPEGNCLKFCADNARIAGRLLDRYEMLKRKTRFTRIEIWVQGQSRFGQYFEGIL